MKSKTAINRKKNRRKKNKAPVKAEDEWRARIEQETLDSLDPIKNAKDESLFVVDTASGRHKLKKNKTTWAERTLTSRGLGLVLPKHTGKTFEEKRKLSEEEKKVIEAKAKRLKTTHTEVKEDVEEGEGEEEEEKKPVVIVAKSKKISRDGKIKTTSVQVYDMWGDKPEPAKNPKHSFIEEILHPKEREFVHKPIESKLAAVPITDADSYHPAPEVHAEVTQQNVTKNKKLSKKAQIGSQLQKKLISHKQFFPRIDVTDAKDGEEEEEEEEGEPIREIPKRHKTAKELKAKKLKRVAKTNKEREEEVQRQQRDVYRIPDILEGIEEKERAREERRAKKLSKRDKRFTVPLSTDGKKIKQPGLTPIAAGGSARLRSLNSVVNPMKERLLSMQNRGLVVLNRNPKKHPKAIYKLVEPQEVREMMREDEEKYLRPILEKK